MAPFGPFEQRPQLAVAVSGGADSMALCLLADGWARAQGGSVLALTVDHRLRPASAGEAATVGRWLAARGIAQAVLVWADPPAVGPLQAAAREARYRLLEAACRERGLLHLLLAHTMEDQAETVLLRFAKGSGVDGVAGMAAVRETADLRLLRPLLAAAKARLRATCAAFGQSWIEDPSNAAARFARGRLRGAAAVLAAEGLTPDRLAESARRHGHARAVLEEATAALLGRAVTLYPEGYAALDAAAMRAARPELALRALAAVLRVIGGGAYPPRRQALERLLAAVIAEAAAGGRTLAGCRIVPGRRLLVVREPAAANERLAIAPGRTVWWDRRFRVTVPPDGLVRDPAWPENTLEVRRIGEGVLSPGPAPAAVLACLPGVWCGETLLAVPQFTYRQVRATCARLRTMLVDFAPANALADAVFGVV